MHLTLVVCNRTLQSAAFMISLVVIPVLAATDAAMLWVECALNILVSIPALSITIYGLTKTSAIWPGYMSTLACVV